MWRHWGNIWELGFFYVSITFEYATGSAGMIQPGHLVNRIFLSVLNSLEDLKVTVSPIELVNFIAYFITLSQFSWANTYSVIETEWLEIDNDVSSIFLYSQIILRQIY